MNKACILSIILIQTLLFAACTNNKENKAEKSTVLVNQSDVDEDAKEFMMAASIGSIMEVELAKVAQQQSSNSTVKDFAEMMIKDHTRIYNELKKLATDKHILLPIELEQEQKQELDELRKVSGSAFDERYMRLMVTNHEKAIADYQTGARNRDRDVNKLASAKIDSLKSHLNSAKSIFNKLIISRP